MLASLEDEDVSDLSPCLTGGYLTAEKTYDFLASGMRRRSYDSNTRSKLLFLILEYH